MTYYKFLGPNGEAVNGGTGSWPLPQDGQPGAWLGVKGKLRPCGNGLHACEKADLLNWIGPCLYEIEPWPTCIVDRRLARKVVMRRARLVRRVEAWNPVVLNFFIDECIDVLIQSVDIDENDRAFVGRMAEIAKLHNTQLVWEMKSHCNKIAPLGNVFHDFTLAGDYMYRGSYYTGSSCLRAAFREMNQLSPLAYDWSLKRLWSIIGVEG